MPNQSVSLTNLDPNVASIQQNRALAELLRKRSGDPIEVQSYQGIQAPISPFSVMAKMLEAYKARKADEEAEAKEQDYQQRDRASVDALTAQLTRQPGQTTLDATTPQLPGGPAPVPQMVNIDAGVKTEGPTFAQKLGALMSAHGGPETNEMKQLMLPQLLDERRTETERQQRLQDIAEQRRVHQQERLEDRSWQQQDADKLTAYQQAQLEQSRNAAARANQGSWGEPQTVTGPDGKPMLVQFNSKGGYRPVEGLRPKPNARAPTQKMISDLSTYGGEINTLGRLNQGFKDEYGGNWIMGDTENFLRRHNPLGDESGQAQWWQDYQSYINRVRNSLFGASLTPGEKAEFEKSVVTPGMSSIEIKKNLARQADIAAMTAKRNVDPYLALGYDKDAVEGALGMSTEDLGRLQPKPKAQQTSTDPQDAKALAWAKAHPDDPDAKEILKLHGH